jgi:orotidine-5'-phosphate decarboxylase
MNTFQLVNEIKRKKSFLCLGLDPEIEKLPAAIRDHKLPLFEFGKRIIDQTHDLIIACKPNLGFYECLGETGWHQFGLTVNYIREHYPEILIIADAKRGDIGNTSKKYAETFFKQLSCDAVTVAPYMGSDSVTPFLEYPGKWVIILALTSNQGAEDFQFLNTGNHERLFETVLRKSAQWGNSDNIMYVVGATRASMLVKVREIVPEHFLLIPGVGAQGGNLAEVAEYGMNGNCGIIVNSSRGIIYADSSEAFASAAREKAKELQLQMSVILVKNRILEE